MREVLLFPDVLRGGGVEDEFTAEESADAAGCGFDFVGAGGD